MAVIAQRLIELGDTDRDTIRALLHQRELPPRVRERLEMVNAADHGQSLATIVAWSGRSIPTLRHWLNRCTDGGAAALTDAPRPGRPVQATAASLTASDQAVESVPSDLGLPFDGWTCARLHAYLADQTGVTISAGWLRTLVTRQRFACVQA